MMKRNDYMRVSNACLHVDRVQMMIHYVISWTISINELGTIP